MRASERDRSVGAGQGSAVLRYADPGGGSAAAGIGPAGVRPHRGSALDPRAGARTRGGPPVVGGGPHRLHRGARPAGPARCDRRTLSANVRRRRATRRCRRDHRLVGRLSPRLPRGLRTGRRRGRGPTGLPGVPKHAERARLHRAGAALRAGHPVPSDDRHARISRSTARWARPRQSGQPDRDDGAAERTRRRSPGGATSTARD